MTMHAPPGLVPQVVRHANRLLKWLATCACITILYAVCMRPDVRLWQGVITHGHADMPTIALTFDDGPHPLWTPLLADTLHRHGAHGTFFLVGQEAQRYPQLLAILTRDGHEIGNHSLSHPYPNLTSLPPAAREREIRDAEQLLRQLSGQQAMAFRPPGGGVTIAMLDYFQQHNEIVAWWSRNLGDAHPVAPAVLAARLRQAQRPGNILLLHQREHTVAALESFLADSTSDGYTYVTFTALRHNHGYTNGQTTRRQPIQ